MQDLLDLHTHSTQSVHAYGTLKENIQAAQAMGLKYYGISEHAPGMPETTSPMVFCNYNVIPRQQGDLTFLTGVELNIMNENGDTDLDEWLLKRLDYAIASLHINCIQPMSREKNTMAYVNVMKNPYVKIIGHPDDGRYDFDAEAVVKAAKQYHKLIEVNNTSLMPGAFRVNSHAIYAEVIKYCKMYEVPIIMGSDAHWSESVGRHENSLKKLQELDFPMELVVNFNQALIDEYILNK